MGSHPVKGLPIKRSGRPVLQIIWYVLCMVANWTAFQLPFDVHGSLYGSFSRKQEIRLAPCYCIHSSRSITPLMVSYCTSKGCVLSYDWKGKPRHGAMHFACQFFLLGLATGRRTCRQKCMPINARDKQIVSNCLAQPNANKQGFGSSFGIRRTMPTGRYERLQVFDHPDVLTGITYLI